MSTIKEIPKRHKCVICGKTRFEKYMIPIKWRSGDIMRTRYGYECWACNPDITQNWRFDYEKHREEILKFRPY